MVAKRGSFRFCDAPVLSSVQQIQGNYQCPMFWNQANDAFLNVKNYNFDINAVEDLLDADVQLLEAGALTIASGLAGPGGALAGLSIDLSGFLASAGDRIEITGTTERQGYINEMVAPNSVYDATGKFTVPLNPSTYYDWIPGTNDDTAKNGTQLVQEGRKFWPQQGSMLALTGAPSKPVTCSVVTRGFRDIYAQNLCLLTIDWGTVVRQQVGTKPGINGVLYYPQVTLLFWAAGYMFASDVTLLQGAGTIVGGISLDNSEGVIASLNAATSSGPPIGSPSVFGDIAPSERYDSISAEVSGNIAVCTGITFVSLSGTMTATQGVFLGPTQLSFTISTDLKTLTAKLPARWDPNYLTFRTTKGDVYTTRTLIL